jgi:hypothetical protein
VVRDDVTPVRRLAAALLRRAMRVVLRANTGPVDALVYYIALGWLAYLAITPDVTFAHSAAYGVLQYKAIWVWPALAKAVLTPLGWASDRAWVHHAARVYAVMWWAYLATATARVAPGLVPFWQSALGCLVAAIWLLAREGANDVAVAPRG